MTFRLDLIFPELLLAAVACVLFLLGAPGGVTARRSAPWIALLTLIVVFVVQATWLRPGTGDAAYAFAHYVKMLASAMGVLLVLLAWPTNAQATGNAALEFGGDGGEFYGLMLLSLAGVFLVAGSNDIILLFLGIELASIPTYIMVSISRPLPVAQEAGVKYFFLGAMAAAVMLFGFSYLYGTTGETQLSRISTSFGSTGIPPWQTLAVVMLVAGFAFKIAAVPLHFYAGDVYQGAATPVTAFLAFVPKTSGFVALIKVLYAAGGSAGTGAAWVEPDTVARLLWVLAALTMTVGNVLGLLQFNVKRVLAYSSIAHSGYMLVGLAALAGSHSASVQTDALRGVLFYLAAYGIMNVAAFGVLILLPARQAVTNFGAAYVGAAGPVPGAPVATSAESFEDLAGTGRDHPALGLAMAVACFSLIGLPLTVGFFGKLFLIKPALDARMYWLVVITMANAAISAAYYLRIVGTMFLRPEPAGAVTTAGSASLQSVGGGVYRAGGARGWGGPVLLSVVLSVIATLVLGIVLPATNRLATGTRAATVVEPHRASASVAVTASR